MRTLYHHPICPFSRKVRVLLAEKKLEFEARIENFWERRDEFVAMNPASDGPVLVENSGVIVADSYAIGEYLEELHREPALLLTDPQSRAEVRRLVSWFDGKFFHEVTIKLTGEKLFKRLKGGPCEPDSRLIRAGYAAVHGHLDYISWLTERRSWLAGSTFSLADISAACQLSCLDYCGDVPWDDHPHAKDWYAKVKSRPSFRPLLADALPGMPPPRHYADLDF